MGTRADFLRGPPSLVLVFFAARPPVSDRRTSLKSLTSGQHQSQCPGFTGGNTSGEVAEWLKAPVC